VACGVLPIAGGYAVLLATNGDGKGRTRTAAVTLDPGLAGASGALTQALAGLTAAEGRDDVRVRGEHAPDADDLELDHDKYLLGVTHTPLLSDAGGPVVATTAQESDDGISPWVFAGIGAGLVGAASIAGLIVTAIVFLQPAPPADRVQKPDTTRVTFEVAP
jgi:hypothetical protein